MTQVSDIHNAIYDRLIADADLTALVGDRIYTLNRWSGRSKTSAHAYPRINFGFMREYEPTQSGQSKRQWWTFHFFAENADILTCQRIAQAVEDVLCSSAWITPTGLVWFTIRKLATITVGVEAKSRIAHVVGDYMFHLRPTCHQDDEGKRYLN